jgi:netrin-G3 ligand
LFANFSASWISQSSRLEQLNIDNTGLTAISSATFKGMNRLTTLNIGHNQIALELDAFNDLSSLERLSMINCSLATWPQAVTRLNQSKLIALTLDDNPLASLAPLTLRGLTRLRELRLRGATLTKLDTDAFRDLSQLQWLDISLNPFQGLPNTVFDPLVNLNRLDLQALLLQDALSLNDRHFLALTSLEVLRLSWRVASQAYVETWGEAFATR